VIHSIVLSNKKTNKYIHQTSIAKPTRDTSVPNLLHFGTKLHMLQMVSLSIIRRSILYIQQHAFVKQILLSACWKQYLFGCCMYSLELLTMDGKAVRNM